MTVAEYVQELLKMPQHLEVKDWTRDGLADPELPYRTCLDNGGVEYVAI